MLELHERPQMNYVIRFRSRQRLYKVYDARTYALVTVLTVLLQGITKYFGVCVCHGQYNVYK